MASKTPLFHLYGDPPDDGVFDFIHVETIASRSSINDWIIQPHRHRNLYQILLIERGSGEMQFEAQTMAFAAPAAIFVPPIVTHAFCDTTVAKFRALVDTHFREERSIAFYASKLSMTPDRLNDHVKRSIGATAGHVIRQRILTEAKYQLAFTMEPIKNIAAELDFSDGSHFSRFFSQYVGVTPQEFRLKGGG